MHITTLASGSSGNCTLVSRGNTHILIDAGISMKRIALGLSSLGLSPADLTGVLITHEHSDHVCGLSVMSRRHDVPFYAPGTVANRLRGSKPELEDALCEIRVSESFCLGEIEVLAFNTPHDTPQSVGYRLQSEGGSFGLATDMGHVSGEVLEGLRGCKTVLLESNHDEEMLRYGPYPYYLKRRILSDNGHLSNTGCCELALELVRGGAETLILGHLSKENNKPVLAYDTVSEALEREGVSLGSDGVCLCVAPPAELMTPRGWEETRTCLA